MRHVIRRGRALAMIGCLLIVGSCSPAGDTDTRASASASTSTSTTTSAATTSTTRPEPVPLEIDHATLTTAGPASYGYLTGPDSVTVVGSSEFTHGSPREVFWRSDAQPQRNQQSCITWTTANVPGEGHPFQPGIAMRITRSGSDGRAIRAITATENVWSYGVWLFNVHLWDTTQPEPMTKIATFDASHIVGRITNVDGRLEGVLAPAPWHLCARTHDETFTLKVWTGQGREPSWDDPRHVFSTPLPASWNNPGYAGGYIGHLGPERSATALLGPPDAPG